MYAGFYNAEGFEPDETYGGTAKSPVNAYGTGDTGFRFTTYWNHDIFSLNAFYTEDNPQTGTIGKLNQEGYWHTARAGLRPKLELELAPEQSLSLIGSFIISDYGFYPGKKGGNSQGGSEGHADLSLIYKNTVAENNALAVGASYGYKEFFNDDQFFSSDHPLAISAVDTQWSEISLFAEDRWTIIDPLSLTLGLRYDHFDLTEVYKGDPGPKTANPDDEDHLSPQIALAYEITPETIAKLSYRHGYRIADAFNYALNPDLGPESVDSYELNLHSQVSDDLTLDFNLFHNEYKDQMAWSKATKQPENLVDKEQSNGAELIAKWDISSDTTLRGSYSYAVVENDLPQKAPISMVKLDLSGKLISDKLHYSLNYVFSSSMDHVDNPDSDTWHEAYKQSQHLVNASLHYDLTESSSITLKVHNLFEDDRPTMNSDEKNPLKGYLGNDERRIYLGFRTSF